VTKTSLHFRPCHRWGVAQETFHRACFVTSPIAAMGPNSGYTPTNVFANTGDAISEQQHHLRFAQLPAVGRKVSDEFTVPLCRGHHRELHRLDEAAWWNKTGGRPRDGRSRALAKDTSTAKHRGQLTGNY
jgi:hypothetical protein